jgi:excisionase family DNA binding protein
MTMADATHVAPRRPTPELIQQLAKACAEYVDAVRRLDHYLVDDEVGALIDCMDEGPSPWPARLDEIERRACSLLAAEGSAPARAAVVTLGEAAETLGIATTSAYRMVREGRFPLPVVRVGRRVMVSRVALEQMFR